MRDVDGAVAVTNSFASVQVHNVHGDLDLSNSNGRVEVRDVRGSAILRNSFASTEFTTIGHNVTVTTNNGRVSGSGVRLTFDGCLSRQPKSSAGRRQARHRRV